MRVAVGNALRFCGKMSLLLPVQMMIQPKTNLPLKGVFVKPISWRFTTRWHALLFLAISPVVLSAFAPSSFAAKTPATLSFNVAARVETKGSGKTNIARSTTGRVFLRGQQVRIESKVGEQNIVMLLLKPYVYRLLPSSKAGVRYKSSTPSPELEAFLADWPTLMNQPFKIRAALLKKGARKTGTAKLGSAAADVYSANRWDGQARPLKIWLRRSDSLPLRLESSASGAKVTLVWSNYQRGAALSSALFAVPKGFRIREGRAPSPMR